MGGALSLFRKKRPANAANADTPAHYEVLQDSSTYHDDLHNKSVYNALAPPQDETRPEEEENFGFPAPEDDSNVSTEGGSDDARVGSTLLSDAEMLMQNLRNQHEEDSKYFPEDFKEYLNKIGHQEYGSIHLDDDDEAYNASNESSLARFPRSIYGRGAVSASEREDSDDDGSSQESVLLTPDEADEAFQQAIKEIARKPKPSHDACCSKEDKKRLKRLLKAKAPDKYAENKNRWVSTTIRKALHHARYPEVRKRNSDKQNAKVKAMIAADPEGEFAKQQKSRHTKEGIIEKRGQAAYDKILASQHKENMPEEKWKKKLKEGIIASRGEEAWRQKMALVVIRRKKEKAEKLRLSLEAAQKFAASLANLTQDEAMKHALEQVNCPRPSIPKTYKSRALAKYLLEKGCVLNHFSPVHPDKLNPAGKIVPHDPVHGRQEKGPFPMLVRSFWCPDTAENVLAWNMQKVSHNPEFPGYKVDLTKRPAYLYCVLPSHPLYKRFKQLVIGPNEMIGKHLEKFAVIWDDVPITEDTPGVAVFELPRDENGMPHPKLMYCNPGYGGAE